MRKVEGVMHGNPTAAIRPVADSDWKPITSIFNHFVTHSFAAYPEQPVDESFFRERRDAQPEFPFLVAETDEKVIGFAYLNAFHPVATLRRSASITYFLHPEYTGRGIGASFLENLLEAGRSLGIENFLAHVSSLNPGSVRFHKKHGFTECGRFANVGIKNGRAFDMVWLQRELNPDIDQKNVDS